MIIKRHLLQFLAILSICFSHPVEIFADDDDPVIIPIHTEPTPPPVAQPQSSSFNLSCYLIGDKVSIVASQSIMAQIIIKGDDDQLIHQAYVPICPEYQIDLKGIHGICELYIEIGDFTYIGEFQL